MVENQLLKVLMLSLFAVAVLAMGIVYAEQQATVTLPYEQPYDSTECINFGVEPLTEGKAGTARYLCLWDWKVDPRILPLINQVINDCCATPEEKVNALIPLIENNPFVPSKEGSGIGDEVGTEVTPEPHELTPDEIVAIKQLAECYRGYDRSHAWGAFVDSEVIPYWLNMTREQFTERDNLEEKQVLGSHVQLLPVLKAIEEYIAIQRYLDLGKIGSEEALKAVHDRMNIGKDGRVVPSIRANEGTPKQDTDSNYYVQAKADAAQRAREFACTPDNIARKLCSPYGQFYGINRGIIQPLVTKDVVVNVPNDAMSGKTAVDIYSLYKNAQAQRDIAGGDPARYMAKINQITCDNYFISYKHQLGTDKFPEWLNTACMAGTKHTQFDLAKRQANE